MIITSKNDQLLREGRLKERGFTDSAVRLFRDVIERSQCRGVRGKGPPLLILWSLLRSEWRLGAYLIDRCVADRWRLEMDIEALLESAEARMDRSSRDAFPPQFADYLRISGIATKARDVASRLQCRYVGTEHVVLALCMLRDKEVGKVFKKHSISCAKLKRELEMILAEDSKHGEME
jgi:hypothetical protein